MHHVTPLSFCLALSPAPWHVVVYLPLRRLRLPFCTEPTMNMGTSFFCVIGFSPAATAPFLTEVRYLLCPIHTFSLDPLPVHPSPGRLRFGPFFAVLVAHPSD